MTVGGGTFDAKAYRSSLFEGAQGLLLLDQNNIEYKPHLTHSNTGLKNVRELCAQAGIDAIDAHYVSRIYLTRHGAGKLPGEDPNMKYHDDTNVDHPFQGKLRFAPLDPVSLYQRISADAGKDNWKLVLTHCDQVPPPCKADLYAYGPSRNRFTEDRGLVE